MSVMQRILDAISQRIAAMVSGAVASRVETMVVLEQVDQQEAIEDRARQLEKDGKPHLAETLRHRMLRIDPVNPAGQGQAILARLADEASTPETPALSAPEPEQEESSPRRRRRATRRHDAENAASEESSDA